MGLLDSDDEDDEPRRPTTKAEPKVQAKSEPKAAEPEVKTTFINSFDDLDVSLLMHVETMVKLVAPKLRDAAAKGASAKFLTDAAAGLQGKMTLQESEQLHKVCKELLTKRQQIEKEQLKKKAQEKEDAKKAKKKEENPTGVDDEDFFAQFC
mmetsp:Transcript_92066/g.260618  ORF Transcript_92066/g.260618 Transcript_92066/m.260618 type:complete len:152 (-) Transcript_92066:116-571(-)|eukprot:CAMPEP_0179294390 /NCGR_PEP_ID=MMETSP0797-20121207/43875_1 /TAXON_ID=47934 /ORGANISM="Dinophysis acuminata, Strain DAEP01" /LENGTH=151 /DNA_ID=CAMNT_0021003589 /DNA_START=88 /DNA_END=543 /DNA_ORIENTATION=+